MILLYFRNIVHMAIIFVLKRFANISKETMRGPKIDGSIVVQRRSIVKIVQVCWMILACANITKIDHEPIH